MILAFSKSSSRNETKTTIQSVKYSHKIQVEPQWPHPIAYSYPRYGVGLPPLFQKVSFPTTIDRPDHSSAVSKWSLSTHGSAPQHGANHALLRSSAVVQGMNTVLRAGLTSASTSGLMMSHQNKLTAVAARRADPRAVLSRISGRTTSNTPMSTRTSIAECLFVIPQSTLRFANSDLESNFMLSITACVSSAFAFRAR